MNQGFLLLIYVLVFFVVHFRVLKNLDFLQSLPEMEYVFKLMLFHRDEFPSQSNWRGRGGRVGGREDSRALWRFVLSILVSSFTSNLCGFLWCWYMGSQQCGFPLHWWAISWSAGKRKVVYVRAGMWIDIKLTKRLVVKIERATSVTQHTSNSIMIKSIKISIKINKLN